MKDKNKFTNSFEKGLSGGTDSNGVTNRMIGQFLFWLQECQKEVFVVATANDVTSLPAELLRKGRFDEMFFVDLPTRKERKEIISLYTQKYLKVKMADNFMNKILEVSEGFSGADLESVIRDIAYKMVAENITLTEELFINSFLNTKPLLKTNPEKIDKIRAWGKERAVWAGKDI